MSVALVRKGLELVDPQIKIDKNLIQVRKNKPGIFGLEPENHKLMLKTQKNGTKVNLLSAHKKLTVADAKKIYKSKEQILKENLKKLEVIRSASKVNLDEDSINKIIERGVEKRPIKKRRKTKKQSKTVFTEEDFKKFEEEYFNE